MRSPAVMFVGRGQVVVQELGVPEPAPGELLIRTEYSLVSTGTERWILRADFHSPGKPPMPFPLVPGYQRVGIVERCGPDVEGFAPGDRVTATVSRLEGDGRAFAGSHAAWGVTPAGECLHVPDGLDPVAASGLVLTQVGYNGGTRPRIEGGETAVVIGDGLVGQWAAQTLRQRGAHVALCGRHPERLRIAAAVSADKVLDESETDVRAHFAARCPGGVDIVDEAVGLIDNVRLAVDLLRHDGQLVFNGYHPEGQDQMSIQWLHDKEITGYGMAGWTRPRMEATLEWLAAGKLNVTDLITHRFPWPRAADAYMLAWNRSEEFLGMVLDWTA